MDPAPWGGAPEPREAPVYPAADLHADARPPAAHESELDDPWFSETGQVPLRRAPSSRPPRGPELDPLGDETADEWFLPEEPTDDGA